MGRSETDSDSGESSGAASNDDRRDGRVHRRGRNGWRGCCTPLGLVIIALFLIPAIAKLFYPHESLVVIWTGPDHKECVVAGGTRVERSTTKCHTLVSKWIIRTDSVGTSTVQPVAQTSFEWQADGSSLRIAPTGRVHQFFRIIDGVFVVQTENGVDTNRCVRVDDGILQAAVPGYTAYTGGLSVGACPTVGTPDPLAQFYIRSANYH